MIMRLSKYLADAGVCARRKAEEEILRGNVAVNGETISELGTKVDTDKDRVAFCGKPVSYGGDHVYIMLHKPEGYVCTVSDEQGRPTVMELVKGVNKRLVPVGRLDYNTSGLLLMTNDGELTYRLTHPRHEVEKSYLAIIEGHPTPEALRSLRSGVMIEGRRTSPAKVSVVKTRERSATLKLTIHEGRNRQVRKMCEATGHRVISLKRIATGKLRLGELPKGECRRLTAEEIDYLKSFK